MTTTAQPQRTLASKVERRINTLPAPDWNRGNGEIYWYDRTLPNGYDIQWASGYAEPGYPDAEIVLLSNWNDESCYVTGPWHPNLLGNNYGLNRWVVLDATATRLYESLERLDGVELEWSDEWAICDECNKCFRTTADSYSWTMYGAWAGDGYGYSCGNCIKADPEAYISDYVNDADKALTMLSENDLEKAGWVKVTNEDSYSGDYHSGWYGRTDTPQDILDELEDDGLGDVVFVVEGVGQFECAFAPYVRAETVIERFGKYQALIDQAQNVVDCNV